jgi:hypothetical protein
MSHEVGKSDEHGMAKESAGRQGWGRNSLRTILAVVWSGGSLTRTLSLLFETDVLSCTLHAAIEFLGQRFGLFRP